MPFISSVRGSYGAQGRFGRVLGLGTGATGGVITTSGSYRIHTFNRAQDGTAFVPDGSGTVEALVLGGGGSGGGHHGGGGGAGGLAITSSFPVTVGTSYTISVGVGGIGGLAVADPRNGANVDGGNSVFSAITAIGGGGGATCCGRNTGFGEMIGRPGGSSGGVGAQINVARTTSNATQTSGTGWTGYGNKGGDGTANGGHASGGGGGAGAVGGTGNFTGSGCTNGAGGNGLASSISGSSVTYAGGGGGGGHQSTTGCGVGGAGGIGGGGTGALNNSNDTTPAPGGGTNGLGGGAGGDSHGGSGDAKAGGTGLVIIRYIPAV
jgi:hypothetical protein